MKFVQVIPLIREQLKVGVMVLSPNHPSSSPLQRKFGAFFLLDHGARRDAQGATHGCRSGDGRAAVRVRPVRRAEDPMRRRAVPADGRRAVRSQIGVYMQSRRDAFVLDLFIL